VHFLFDQCHRGCSLFGNGEVPALIVGRGEDAVGITGEGRVPTSIRSLYILEVLAAAGTPLTPTAINAHLGLPKPTIHRLCQKLEAEGFLEADLEGGGYRPGPRLRSVASGVITFASFAQARHAILQRLSEEIGETCNITIPESEGMRYLDRVETRWPLRVAFPIGGHVPFHCSASGKLYLSSLCPVARDKLIAALTLQPCGPNAITDPQALVPALEKIAQDQLGTDDEELVDGMVAIAVPICDDHGRLVATLAVHAPVHRMTLAEAAAKAPLLRAAAQALRARPH